MSFRSYTVRRFIGSLITFFIIATILFFLFRQIGSPLGLHISDNMSPEQVREVKAAFGLDEPLYTQYLLYLESIVTLNFGNSFFYGGDVADIVLTRLYNSLFLTIPSILLAYFFGVIGGTYIGWKRGEFQERIGLITALIFRSTPRFWLGLMLLFIVAGELGLLALGGMLPVGTEYESHFELLLMPEFYKHLILPILSMTFYLAGLPLLLMRTSLFEVMNEEYIDIIRAKGASKWRVMFRHGARNAILPVTTAFGVAIGFSFGGNILIENVFSYPGVGRLMVNAVFQGDFPVAQFSFLMMAAVILLMNFLVDIAYSFLDPRVTH
jgi:peptide/nickel transport system permease protein